MKIQEIPQRFQSRTQAFFTKVFRWLMILADARRGFPWVLKLLVKAAVGVCIISFAARWGLSTQKNPDFWTWDGKSWCGTILDWKTIFTTVLTGTTTFLVFVFFNGFVPLLAYIPYAVSMRSMGLLLATIEADDGRKLLLRCLAEHDSKRDSEKQKDPIRIICISGKRLFRNVEGSYEAPLHEVACQGRLHVIMPVTSSDNVTIKKRFESYSKKFRESQYPQIEKLVEEVKDSKTYLDLHGNTVVEHDNLCMWRVVLFSEHCVVQAYFPNHRGSESDYSPMFVFRRGEDCDLSYYHTFEQMFILLSQQKPSAAPSLKVNGGGKVQSKRSHKKG